jgi:endo-1,4-beta-xylanase
MRYTILAAIVCISCEAGAVLAADVSDELRPEAINARIRQYRMGELVVQAGPGAEVRVQQLHHEFWFGAALTSGAFTGRFSADDQQRYRETFLANFNAGVFENALKWHSMEPRRGDVNYSLVDTMLAWADKHHIPVRGHCIFWGVPNRVQPWLKAMDDATLRQTLKARALDIGRRYRRRFAEYDLNNEMMHANYYAERLGPGITRQMADWVKEADPNARLFVNDYDVLTGRRLNDYIKHIRGLLAQGVPLSGIGVQGHLHGDSFDPKALQRALDELAKIGLPIRITEFNFPGQHSIYMKRRNLKLTPEQEQAKAKALTQYYRICFAHPAVEGILMWGFWEGANWIPQSSLYRRDWTPTPAAEAYRDLIFKQWWTKWEGKADANGISRIPAFYGKYAVTCDGQTKQVQLSKQAGQATIRFE